LIITVFHLLVCAATSVAVEWWAWTGTDVPLWRAARPRAGIRRHQCLIQVRG